VAFYDFLIYAIFATQIGRAFFPAASATSSLLSALAAFGAGFAMRPIGAFVMGRFADRRGRVRAMRLNFLLMASAMFAFAALPAYSYAGITMTIIAVLLRLVQGFAIGGELGPSTAFLFETAPRNRRGFYTAFQLAGQNAAIVIAGLVGLLLASAMSATALAQYGWRLAFVVGGLLLAIAYPLRRSLDTDSPSQVEHSPSQAVTKPRFFILASVILAQSSVSIYVLLYMATFATTTLHVPAQHSFLPTLAVGLACLISCPLSGLLSDHVGRKPVMLVFTSMLLVAALPAFQLVMKLGTINALVLWCVFAAACASMASTAAFVSITESLPARRRSLQLGLLYATVASLLGGTTQFAIAWLIVITGQPAVPAIYLSGALLLGLGAMLLLPESRLCEPATSVQGARSSG
jgi:MFS family permease